jgi:hypothetical protein
LDTTLNRHIHLNAREEGHPRIMEPWDHVYTKRDFLRFLNHPVY